MTQDQDSARATPLDRGLQALHDFLTEAIRECDELRARAQQAQPPHVTVYREDGSVLCCAASHGERLVVCPEDHEQAQPAPPPPEEPAQEAHLCERDGEPLRDDRKPEEPEVEEPAEVCEPPGRGPTKPALSRTDPRRCGFCGSIGHGTSTCSQAPADLMVTPESVDSHLDANPPPPEEPAVDEPDEVPLKGCFGPEEPEGEPFAPERDCGALVLQDWMLMEGDERALEQRIDRAIDRRVRAALAAKEKRDG